MRMKFVYDQARRVSCMQDQECDTVKFNDNLAGRFSTLDYRTAANSPSGAIADADQFSFDKAGPMLSAYSSRYSNTVGYSYDAPGRKKTESLTIKGHIIRCRKGVGKRCGDTASANGGSVQESGYELRW